MLFEGFSEASGINTKAIALTREKCGPIITVQVNCKQNTQSGFLDSVSQTEQVLICTAFVLQIIMWQYEPKNMDNGTWWTLTAWWRKQFHWNLKSCTGLPKTTQALVICKCTSENSFHIYEYMYVTLSQVKSTKPIHTQLKTKHNNNNVHLSHSHTQFKT